MLCAVGNILRRLIDCIKPLLSERFIYFTEPTHIEGAHVQLLLREWCIFGNNGSPFFIELLIHVRHEIVAAGHKSFPAQIFADDRQPLR